ncbi:Phage tail protein [Vibrio crassostreae]|uniref:hypothetical protein n=1 Tax=Vibrio crassostreae TaxID=246167 RepID=UPI00105052A6|nr:hypothetical protein [Vibrio crassostreae]TCT58471.1 hypothetical protein EDB44_12091 [Vibrio crassostreae]TCT79999.1 hypothetical protein EDB43_12091 [Vibrio crassostreae]TCU01074.1 hypothetical protein EDB47_12029 [Vibrio crassostreae]CAK1755394.1 Phage tail protein [Vibrio crassostreae]CAK1807634.1 Phage tail protein [Vibrio crassostreae]
MSDFTAIGQLVTEARNLLDSIKGGAIRTMQTQVDALKKAFSSDTQQALNDFASASNAKIAQQDQALRDAVEPIIGKLATIALSPNQTMMVESGATVPKGFRASKHVTLEKIETISSSPTARSGYQLQILSEMENDIRLKFPDFSIRKTSHYSNQFNVFRVSWDLPEDTDMNGAHWTIFPGTVPLSGIVSCAAFVKLEEGLANGSLMSSSTLGKWVFSQHTYKGNFGTYVNAHPIARTPKGSFLIALPVLSTGYLNHPKKLFFLAGLDK